MRTVLLVAFHFPPFVGSSGVQRALRFAQYLPKYGWRPVVLTVTPDAYERSDLATLATIPDECEVIRARCFDAARHFAIGGRYPGILAVPDRWASWAWLGTGAGVRACRRLDVRAVWSTYPIATAHRLGAAIARQARLPWIADFRDPMAQSGYPSDPRRWQAFRDIEETAAREAVRMVFVTPSAVAAYRELFPSLPADRFELLENGYDESVFSGAGSREQRRCKPSRPIVLLHSGIVYPSERDPTALMAALARLRAEGRITPARVRVRFRAATHEALLRTLAEESKVSDFIEIAPPIPYADAIAEMLESDALLIMQGCNCNAQIPAKIYEYLRAGSPILGLADPSGDTGRTLLACGYHHVAALEDADAIARTLLGFIDDVERDTAPIVAKERVAMYDRRALTGHLARVLDEVSGS